MQARSLRAYLVLINILLVVFAIWFANTGLLSFRNFSDFAVFVGFGLILALYRPGWTFLFFIGAVALENLNLAPEVLGIAIRPYQFFAALIIVALLFREFQKKNPVKFPKFNWADWAVLIFALASFLSALFAIEKGIAFKQSLVALSFIAIYFLVRAFVQNISDVKKIMPFFLSSSLVILIYGIWQNVRFAKGLEHFEVMPGRPNATFAEADWYGIFLVFVIAVVYSFIYRISREDGFEIKNQKSKIKITNQNVKLFLSYALLVLTFVVLILTVARSAWLGAAIVTVGFLKQILFFDSWKIKESQWRKTGYAAFGIFVAFALALGVVKIFHLSSFELGNRAQSVAGLQEITVSCEKENFGISKNIKNISELAIYGCAHIKLEEIEKEKAKGNFVSTVLRPDPNVGVRAEIYRKSWNEIKNNPVFGIGWGNIGKILGTDERGASFNSSNIFLEVWLGSGVIGLISFIFIFGYILTQSLVLFYKSDEDGKIVAVFAALGAFAIIVPNLFNAGIFLGFLWAYLGVAVSLLNREK